MDRLEFDKHLGYASPKEMASHFTNNAAVFDMISWNDLNVSVTLNPEDINELILVPIGNSNCSDLVKKLISCKTRIHGRSFEFNIKEVNDTSVIVTLDEY